MQRTPFYFYKNIAWLLDFAFKELEKKIVKKTIFISGRSNTLLVLINTLII